MIVRIFKGTVVAGAEREWQQYVEANSLPWLKSQKGIAASYTGKPLPGTDGRTFCIISVWDSVESIAASVGAEWDKPLYFNDESEQLLETSSLEHFEIFP